MSNRKPKDRQAITARLTIRVHKLLQKELSRAEQRELLERLARGRGWRLIDADPA